MTDIAAYYDQLSDSHPPGSPQAVDGSGHSLYRRYEVLTKGLEGKHVLDIGCGHANMYKYMLDNEIEFSSYTGIDIAGRSIEEATKLYNRMPAGIMSDGKIVFHEPITLIHTPLQEYDPVDLLTQKTKQYDIVLAQGIFYKLGDNPEGYQQALNLIRMMVRLAKKEIRFCALSTWGDCPDEGELLINPVTMLAWLSEHFGRNITFRHDYLPHDCFFKVGREDY